MKATFKSKQQFLDEGFKSDYPYWYKGTKRDAEARVRSHLIENLAGKIMNVVDIDDCNTGTIIAERDELRYRVETWMFCESVKLNQISKPETIQIKGSPVKFYGLSFHFDCRHGDLNLKDARKIAKWILSRKVK